MEKKQKIKSIIIAISLLLFFVSLFMPVYEGQWNEGWTMLSIGWLSTLFFMQNPWQLVWFANPLYFLAIYYWVKDRKSQRYRVALTSMASSMAVSFFFCHKLIYTGSLSVYDIGDKQIGYYLWATAIVVLSVGMLYEAQR